MTKKLILKNGLRLILVPQPSAVAATALILVEAGSEYEIKEKNGLSHFLEHMVFKGTKNRPVSGAVSAELDGLGAEYNAFTGQEYTGYWAKAEKGKVHKLLEIVSDLYLNPLFDSKEIDKERGVIIEEINMYEDLPMRRVHDLFTTLLYGDQPAGWDIAGRKEVIRRLTREDFVTYRGAHYIPPKTVVAIAGNINAADTEREVKKFFGALPRGKSIRKPKTMSTQSRPAAFVKHKESDQAHLVLGVRAFSIFDKRKYALHVLSDVLGGGMSSRLFTRIRDELGAAYYVRASDDLALDHGEFTVSVGADTKRVDEVIEIILEELRRLAHVPVPEKELQKAKDHLVGTMMLGLESSDELASFYGMQELLLCEIRPLEDAVKKIRAVTAADIGRVAKGLFISKHLNLAVIGPYNDRERFRRMLKL